MAVPGIQVPNLGRRIASMAYESLLLLGVLSVFFLLPHVILGIGFSIALPGWMLIVHVFMLVGCYFVWYWQHGGQTLAMQTWKIKISTPSGAKPSPAQLILRYALSWPSISCLGVGLLWALIDPDRQFLHDRLAGTRLIFKQS
ncbi:MAG: RDD family protein [Betaproteobacteria bacterium]|nr:RDD family protein [Betaproteobacteria bacterium]